MTIDKTEFRDRLQILKADKFPHLLHQFEQGYSHPYYIIHCITFHNANRLQVLQKKCYLEQYNHMSFYSVNKIVFSTFHAVLPVFAFILCRPGRSRPSFGKYNWV